MGNGHIVSPVKGLKSFIWANRFKNAIKIALFSRATTLLFNWKYFWGWNLVWMTCRWHTDDMWMMCGWHVDDMRVRFRVRFHQQMTYVIRMSSTCHLHTCLSCPISCSTTPGVIHTLSADTHIICMSSAHCLHVVCTHICHPHVICMSSAHLPELLNFMQYYTWCHPHFICRHTHHLQVVCTSSADAHIISNNPHGPELCFLCQRYKLLMSLWFLIWFLMWPCLRHIVCTSSPAVSIVPVDSNYVSCPKDSSFWCHCGSWCGSWCGPV